MAAWDDILDDLIGQMDTEVRSKTPNFARMAELQNQIENHQKRSPSSVEPSPSPRKPSSELLTSEPAVRSNRTNKRQSLGAKAKREFEIHSSRAAVIGPEGNIDRARPGETHGAAILNRAEKVYGKNLTGAQLDAMVDTYYNEQNFNKNMGFTTPREPFVSREVMQARAREKYNLQGRELHAGRLEWERQAHQSVEGVEADIAESRRGAGPEAEKTLKKRKGIQKMEQKINRELRDLRRRPVMEFDESGVKHLVKDRQPTLKHSPHEVQTEGAGSSSSSPKNQEVLARRIDTLDKRRQVIRRNKGLLGPGTPSETKVLGRLSNLARGLGKGTKKALGPLAWLTEPVATIGALKDYASGDEARMLRATEHFQGLPEGSTGRGYTEDEKRDMEDQNLAWYDPRRREGGI